MSLYKSAKSVMTVATADLPRSLSHDWPKRLARRMGVPLRTARYWIYEGMPAARRREIAAAVLAECDRLLAEIAETKSRFAGEPEHEAGRVVDFGSTRAARSRDREMGRPVRH